MLKTKFQIEQTAAKYRGEFLNEVSVLENCIDTYIAKHFVGNDPTKRYDFIVGILGNNRMTLDGKKQAFDFLAKKHDSKWLNNYKSIRPIVTDNMKQGKIIKPHTFMSDLNYLIEKRNIFAHYLLDDTEDAKLMPIDEVTFIRFRDSVTPFMFNDEIVKELMFVIMDITNYFIQRIEKWEVMRPSS